MRHHLKKLSSEQQQKSMLGIIAFHRKSVEHLQKRLPLGNSLIMNIGCLNPLKKADTVSESVKCIQQFEPTIDVVLVTDEWKCYKQDRRPENCSLLEGCIWIEERGWQTKIPSSNNKTLNARLLARVITGCHYT